jgi:hypothetical protein
MTGRYSALAGKLETFWPAAPLVKGTAGGRRIHALLRLQPVLYQSGVNPVLNQHQFRRSSRSSFVQEAAARSVKAIMDALLPRLLPADREADTEPRPDFATKLRPKIDAMRLAMANADTLNLGAVDNAMNVVGMLEARLVACKRAVHATRWSDIRDTMITKGGPFE